MPSMQMSPKPTFDLRAGLSIVLVLLIEEVQGVSSVVLVDVRQPEAYRLQLVYEQVAGLILKFADSEAQVLTAGPIPPADSADHAILIRASVGIIESDASSLASIVLSIDNRIVCTAEGPVKVPLPAEASVTLGADGEGSHEATFEFAEMMTFTRKLADAELGTIWSYADSRYALASNAKVSPAEKLARRLERNAKRANQAARFGVVVKLDFSDEESAREVSRVIDAASGLPSRDDTISPSHRIHARESADTPSRGAAKVLKVDGGFTYPVHRPYLHLVQRALMLRGERSDLYTLQIVELRGLALHAGHLSGIARRILHGLDPKLWDEAEALGIEKDATSPEGRVRIWRTNWGSDDRDEAELDALLDDLGVSELRPKERDLRWLVHAIETCEGSVAWQAFPVVLTDGRRHQVLFVGVPTRHIRATSSKPLASQPFGFNSLVGATIYLFCARLTRLIERIDLLSGEEIRGLAPSKDVAAVFLAHTLAPFCAESPDLNLSALLTEASHLSHEGATVAGQLAFNPSTLGIANFAEPVPITTPRLLRKMVVASSEGTAVFASAVKFVGIGRVGRGYRGPLIKLIGRGQWQLHADASCLMKVDTHGVRLPSTGDFTEDVRDCYQRIFATEPSKLVLDNIDAGAQAGHGCLLIFCDEPEAGDNETSSITMCFAGEALEAQLVESLSKIDGAMIFDRAGLCFRAGVILAPPPSLLAPSMPYSSERGARYNTALRFSNAAQQAGVRAVVVVISEDGYVDVFPKRTPLDADRAGPA